MTIIKSVKYIDIGNHRLRDRDLGTLKLRKNNHFCIKNLLIHLKVQNRLK